MTDDRIDELEERLLILRDKAAREGFDVPDDVLQYIAGKYALPQTLKGAVINVSAYAQRRGIAVDMDVARLVLDGIRPVAAPEEQVAGPEGVEAAAEVSRPETLEDTLAAVLAETVVAGEPQHASEVQPDTLFGEPEAPSPPAPPVGLGEPEVPSPPAHVISQDQPQAPGPAAAGATESETCNGPSASETTGASYEPAPAQVWFAPVRSAKKESLVKRAGRLLERAGLEEAVSEGDLVAIKLHFGEEGNTGFVNPVFVREVVRLVRMRGAKPFLTDSNTLYRGERSNAVDHIACAVHNGFSYSTVEAPIVIADGIDGRDAVDVPIAGFDHFDSVRIGAAAAHADAMVVVTHVKGHEATGFGGALKNVGMGLGCRSAKQRMHSDLKPQVDPGACTACRRCVTWCPVAAIAITPDRVARIDYELCYGCGECVAACPYGAIAIQWKTEPRAIQEKIVEHAAGAVSGKAGKVIYLSFVMDVTPDCDCWHFSDASIVPDIGVLASSDIVAIDQAAYDLVTERSGLPGTRGEGLGPGVDKFHAITGVDATLGLAYAERHGLGTRRYELRTLD